MSSFVESSQVAPGGKEEAKDNGNGQTRTDGGGKEPHAEHCGKPVVLQAHKPVEGSEGKREGDNGYSSSRNVVPQNRPSGPSVTHSKTRVSQILFNTKIKDRYIFKKIFTLFFQNHYQDY